MASSMDDLAGDACPPLSSSSPPSGVPLHIEEPSISAIGTGGREELRGLGGEVIRLTFHSPCHDLHPVGAAPIRLLSGSRIGGRYGLTHASSWSMNVSRMVKAADPDLHAALHPYEDPALLECHGEQLLDIIIRLASKKEWKGWVKDSMKTAASAGAMDVLLRLFASYGDSVDDRTLSWLLDAAAKGGSVELLSALFAAGAGPLVRVGDEASRQYTALHWAAKMGHRICVAKLVEAGAPVDSRRRGWGTALTEAVKGCHKGVALELLAAGADVNKVGVGDRAPYADFSPLGIAVDKNDEEMVKVLLEAGAEPCKGPADFLPLHLAASLGSYEISNSLLLAGAKVDLVDSDGRSALHLACAYNQCDVADLLLRHNASVTSLCNHGLSPMDVVGAHVLAIRQWGAVRDSTTGQRRLIPEHVPKPGLRVRGCRRRCCRPPMAHPCTLNSAETYNVDKICDMLKSAGAWGRRGWLVMMRYRPLAEAVGELPDRSDANDLTLSVLAKHVAHEPSRNAAGPSGTGGVARALHDGGQARTDWSAAVVRLLRVPEESLFCNIVRFL